jgi:hypothetical protein
MLWAFHALTSWPQIRLIYRQQLKRLLVRAHSVYYYLVLLWILFRFWISQISDPRGRECWICSIFALVINQLITSSGRRWKILTGQECFQYQLGGRLISLVLLDHT